MMATEKPREMEVFREACRLGEIFCFVIYGRYLRMFI